MRSDEKNQAIVRVWSLQTDINKAIIEARRDPKKVALALEAVLGVLQGIVNQPAEGKADSSVMDDSSLEVKDYLVRSSPDEMITVGVATNKEILESSPLFKSRVHRVGKSLQSLQLPPSTDDQFFRETRAIRYDLIKDGLPSVIFQSLGSDRCLWKHESQILRFCKDNPEKLRKGAQGTFFELEGFIIRVKYISPDVLEAYLYFSLPKCSVLDVVSNPCFVIPQPASAD